MCASVIVARPAIILSLLSEPQVDAGAGGNWSQWDQGGPRGTIGKVDTPNVWP